LWRPQTTHPNTVRTGSSLKPEVIPVFCTFNIPRSNHPYISHEVSKPWCPDIINIITDKTASFEQQPSLGYVRFDSVCTSLDCATILYFYAESRQPCIQTPNLGDKVPAFISHSGRVSQLYAHTAPLIDARRINNTLFLHSSQFDNNPYPRASQPELQKF
jgi:hypothetical protein